MSESEKENVGTAAAVNSADSASKSNEDKKRMIALFKLKLEKANFQCETRGLISEETCRTLDLLEAYFLRFTIEEAIEISMLVKLIDFMKCFLINDWLWEEELKGSQCRLKKCGGTKYIDKAKFFVILNEICLIADKFGIMRNGTKPEELIPAMERFWWSKEFDIYSKYTFPILVNLTRNLDLSNLICKEFGYAVLYLIEQLSIWQDSEKCTNKFENGAMILANVTVSEFGRRLVVSTDKLNLFYKFLKVKSSISRRYLFGAIKNCCFDLCYNVKFLTDSKVLATMLLPLAGPEVLPPEDKELLPSELQNLSATKEREPDTETRRILLEGLYKLCQTRPSREYLREKNIYVILREYHIWEQNEELISLLECIVNILLQDEEEIGVDNFAELNINENNEEFSRAESTEKYNYDRLNE